VRILKAFTLVEILIVLAMAALLGSIATNLGRNAFTRSRVAEERQNMQRMRIALQNYYVDSAEYLGHSEYPPDTANEEVSWYFLTTPTAYLPALPRSVFADKPAQSSLSQFWFIYWGGPLGTFQPWAPDLRKKFYAFTSAGPDGVRQSISGDLWQTSGTMVIIRESANFRNKLLRSNQRHDFLRRSDCLARGTL
jgi:prepilin-type N-terminal cleavage/methylation domain-containing protein